MEAKKPVTIPKSGAAITKAQETLPKTKQGKVKVGKDLGRG